MLYFVSVSASNVFIFLSASVWDQKLTLFKFGCMSVYVHWYFDCKCS